MKLFCGMQLSDYKDIYLTLVRFGIGHEASDQTESVDWNAIKAFATEQGLPAVVLHGIDKISARNASLSNTLPIAMKLEWIGEVLQNYEQRYVAYEKAIEELAAFYNEHGFKMMVLKGYACSLDWPIPNQRPCGDIDIWLFGQWKEADIELRKTLGSKFKIDGGHHHHTVFEWHGFTVENHYDFVNVYIHKNDRELEKCFKELGQDDTCSIVIGDEKVYLPSPNLNALFLMKHMINHFTGEKVTLRQVLDWAFFVKKHFKDIDWNWLEGMSHKNHMTVFYNCINAICVGDLGFDVGIFPKVQFDPALKDRVLEDILSPDYGDEPKELFKRIVFKYRRWRGNAWKYKMCYNESLCILFWRGIWNHLLKPASI